MTTAQIRYSILSPDRALSALKFRGWFRQETANIQTTAKGPDDIIIIRLYMPHRLIAGITQRKLDVILQGAVDSNPNIQRVELLPVVGTMSFDEMLEAANEAKEDMRKLAEEYADSANEDEPPVIH